MAEIVNLLKYACIQVVRYLPMPVAILLLFGGLGGLQALIFGRGDSNTAQVVFIDFVVLTIYFALFFGLRPLAKKYRPQSFRRPFRNGSDAASSHGEHGIARETGLARVGATRTAIYLRAGAVVLMILVLGGSIGRYQAAVPIYGYWSGLAQAVSLGQIIALVAGIVLFGVAAVLERKQAE